MNQTTTKKDSTQDTQPWAQQVPYLTERVRQAQINLTPPARTSTTASRLQG
jgi:hypothetical protein